MNISSEENSDPLPQIQAGDMRIPRASGVKMNNNTFVMTKRSQREALRSELYHLGGEYLGGDFWDCEYDSDWEREAVPGLIRSPYKDLHDLYLKPRTTLQQVHC